MFFIDLFNIINIVYSVNNWFFKKFLTKFMINLIKPNKKYSICKHLFKPYTIFVLPEHMYI